jgi:hypothetical protein
MARRTPAPRLFSGGTRSASAGREGWFAFGWTSWNCAARASGALAGWPGISIKAEAECVLDRTPPAQPHEYALRFTNSSQFVAEPLLCSPFES